MMEFIRCYNSEVSVQVRRGQFDDIQRSLVLNPVLVSRIYDLPGDEKVDEVLECVFMIGRIDFARFGVFRFLSRMKGRIEYMRIAREEQSIRRLKHLL